MPGVGGWANRVRAPPRAPVWTSSRSGAGSLQPAPDFGRDLDHQLELAPLDVGGDLVAVMRAGEAPLRADAGIVERHELRPRLDSPSQRVLGLELGLLSADQP